MTKTVVMVSTCQIPNFWNDPGEAGGEYIDSSELVNKEALTWKYSMV